MQKKLSPKAQIISEFEVKSAKKNYQKIRKAHQSSLFNKKGKISLNGAYALGHNLSHWIYVW